MYQSTLRNGPSHIIYPWQHRTLSRLSSKYEQRSHERLHARYLADDESSSLANGFAAKSEGNVNTVSSSSVSDLVVTPPHSPKYPQVEHLLAFADFSGVQCQC